MNCKLVSRMVTGTCAHSAGVNKGVNNGVNIGVNIGVNEGVNNLRFNANYRIDGTLTATPPEGVPYRFFEENFRHRIWVRHRI